VTTDEIHARLDAIREMAVGVNGSSTAHAAQDDLLVDVLQAIADGAADPPALAREALRVLDIAFSRWYE
jgi:hypothetical protein